MPGLIPWTPERKILVCIEAIKNRLSEYDFTIKTELEKCADNVLFCFERETLSRKYKQSIRISCETLMVTGIDSLIVYFLDSLDSQMRVLKKDKSLTEEDDVDRRLAFWCGYKGISDKKITIIGKSFYYNKEMIVAYDQDLTDDGIRQAVDMVAARIEFDTFRTEVINQINKYMDAKKCSINYIIRPDRVNFIVTCENSAVSVKPPFGSLIQVRAAARGAVLRLVDRIANAPGYTGELGALKYLTGDQVEYEFVRLDNTRLDDKSVKLVTRPNEDIKIRDIALGKRKLDL